MCQVSFTHYYLQMIQVAFYKNYVNLFKSINYELEKIAEWLRANKLSVNVNKTEYMVFR